MALRIVLLLAAAADAWLQTATRTPPRLPTTRLRASKDDLGRREALALGLAQALGVALAPDAAGAAGELGRVVPAADLLAAAAAAPAKRKVVVTGANSGVGLEGAKLLAAAGHDVVCACRTAAKAEAAAAACGGKAVPAVCDLADLKSVKAFAASVKDVDTLVLNAGLALSTKDTAAQRTKQGFELTIGTNHLGHMALYELLEKRLAAAKGSVVRR